MSFPEIASLVVALATEHVPTVLGVVTAAIALFTYYTGLGPKLLPKRYQPLPALALTVAMLEWLGVEQYGAAPNVVVAALVAGVIAGAGSNVAHISLQSAAKIGMAKK